MHLAILTQYYPPEIGAPQTRLSELAAHVIRRGHAVTVLTAMPNYPTGTIYPGYGGVLRRENRDGADVIRSFIYPTQRADFIRRLTNYFSFVLSSSIAGTVKLKHPDYLLVESPPLFLGLAGFYLSRLKRTRLIFNVSDLWPESAVRLGVLDTRGVAHRLSSWLESFCYRHAWLVSGQSRSILSNISERFPGLSTFLFSNGVDVDQYRPGRESAAARESLTAADGFVSLYTGLHGLAQGLDQLLGAAAALRDEKDFRFVLIGDGPEKVKLIQRSQEENLTNVRFLDPRPAAEIPALTASADAILVILKTHIPGAVPSKLYEAMSSGRPVVLVANGEPADLVRRHNAGIAIEPGDVQGFVRAMRQLREQPELRRVLGENGRTAALQFYDRRMIASKFIEHLETHLQSNGASALTRSSGEEYDFSTRT